MGTCFCGEGIWEGILAIASDDRRICRRRGRAGTESRIHRFAGLPKSGMARKLRVSRVLLRAGRVLRGIMQVLLPSGTTFVQLFGRSCRSLPEQPRCVRRFAR